MKSIIRYFTQGERGVLGFLNMIPLLFICVIILWMLLTWLLFILLLTCGLPHVVFLYFDYVMLSIGMRLFDFSPLLLMPMVVNLCRRRWDCFKQNLLHVVIVVGALVAYFPICLIPGLTVGTKAGDEVSKEERKSHLNGGDVNSWLVALFCLGRESTPDDRYFKDENGVFHYEVFQSDWKHEIESYHLRMIPRAATNICLVTDGGFGWQKYCISCVVDEVGFEEFRKQRMLEFKSVNSVPSYFMDEPAVVFKPLQALQGESLLDRALYCEKEGPKDNYGGHMQFLYDKKTQTLYVDYWD